MRDHAITSLSNQAIKDLVRLRERKGDRAESEFVVEGAREISRALSCGYIPVAQFVCDDLLSEDARQIFTRTRKELTTYQVTTTVFAKIAVRESRDGLIFVFKTRSIALDSLPAKLRDGRNLIVAVEDVEKPGNLGAILRSADGAGVGAVIVLDHSVDIYNSNVIRASLGGLFAVPVVSATSSEFSAWCGAHGWATVAAALGPKSKDLFEIKMTGPTAIILGREATGLSDFWLQNADQLAVIPMLGVCDSLNVSVAASVFMYEYLRQSRGH